MSYGEGIGINALRNRRASKAFHDQEVHTAVGAVVFEIPVKWRSENGNTITPACPFFGSFLWACKEMNIQNGIRMFIR